MSGKAKVMKNQGASKPLRGEDAWLKAKADIAKRNEDARTRIAEHRADERLQRVKRRREQAELEAASMPEPPQASRAPSLAPHPR